MKWSIGIDLHKTEMMVAVLDEQGQLVKCERLACKCRQKIADFFASYGQDSQVAVESCGFYHWLWELLEPQVGKLFLADPVGVRAAAGREPKTDRRDAHLLARLVREDRLPKAHVPAEPYRTLRDWLRLRHHLAHLLAGERRFTRWIFLKGNFAGPQVLTSDRLLKWLRTSRSRLNPVAEMTGTLGQEHIARIEREIDQLEDFLATLVRGNPKLAREVERLESVPGFGRLSAMTVLAETAGLSRFSRPTPLCAFAGLVPSIRQSGTVVHLGHISKRGPADLRWILQEAAWAAIRSDEHVRRFYNRLRKRTGTKKAATAVARKLLVYAWAVHRNGKPFAWPTPPLPKPRTPTLEPTGALGTYTI